MEPTEDAGWHWSWRTLLVLVPGGLPLLMRRAENQNIDGLDVTRQVWIAFVSAIILFGVVLAFITTGDPVGSAAPWIVGLTAVALVALTIESIELRRPLACEDNQALAESFRKRYFLCIAFSGSSR